jgi:hypothetical protein
MRVIVAGSRDFFKWILLCEKLGKILKNIPQEEIVIISGGANGADKLGEKYASLMGYRCEVYKADWDKYKGRAGILRNRDMSEEADALIAFWDGQSRGTKDMIEVAKAKGLKVRVIMYKN